MQIQYRELIGKLKELPRLSLTWICAKANDIRVASGPRLAWVRGKANAIRVAIGPSLEQMRGAVSRPTAITSLGVINLLFAAALFAQAAHPVLPGPQSASAQGQIGIPILRLTDISIHPVTAIITNKAPVCLVFLGVEIERRFWDGELYLMNGTHTYPAADIRTIGQDTLFGQKQTRAIAFHPDELCKRGPFTIKDLSLLLVHPSGVGIISFAGGK